MTLIKARTAALKRSLVIAQAGIVMFSLFSVVVPTEALAVAIDTPAANLVVKKVLVGAPENVHYSDFSFNYDKQGATPAVTVAFEADGQNDLSVATGAYDVTEVAAPNFTVAYSSNQQGHENDCNNLSAGSDQNVAQHGPVICTITNTYVAPEEPQSCDFVSDATTMVGDSPAVPTFVHAAWTHGLDITGAQWIWSAALATPSDESDEVVTFTKTFNVVGTPSAVSLDLAADNYYTVSVNGTAACINGADLDNFSSVEPTCDITSLVHAGVNTLTFSVTNAKGYGTDPQTNPGGLEFHVHIADAACAAVPPPTEQPAHLTVIKHVVGAPEGVDASDFTLTVSQIGGEDPDQSAAGSESGHVYEVSAGSYNVTEAEVPNYEVSYGDNCKSVALSDNGQATCTVTNTYVPPAAPSCVIVSDTQTMEGGTPASLVSTLSVYWTALIDSASWIWGEDPTSETVPNTETFTRTFTLDAVPAYAQIDIAADDGYVVKVNGVEIGADDGTSQVNFSNVGQDWYQITNLVAGENTLEVVATNLDWHTGNNPAGILYKVTIDEANCVTNNDGGDDDQPVIPHDSHGPVQTESGSNNGDVGGGGSVAGESTASPEVLGESCGLYMDKYLRFGHNDNDPEQTKKLQTFLNKWMSSNLPITGFFGKLTEQQVKAFQSKYGDDILKPWGLTSPTGLVYLSTLLKINKLECPELTLELPPLVPWSQNPEAH